MILIRDVLVVDGTGKAPYKADVLLRRDRISAIGRFPKMSADLTIDGSGGYITPGFIDVNTDSDHYLTLFTNPEQEDFLLQGATTIVGGHCGSSLAPLLYGSLESIRKWTDPNQINVDWHTVKEFLAALQSRRLGVNFLTLAGHSTVRRALIGEEMRDLTEGELAVFTRIIEDAIKDGVFGISTGLAYAHARLAPYSEIKRLVGVSKKNGGVYATHLRNETNGLLESINETLALAKETGITTIISHLRPIRGFENQFGEAIEKIEGARKRGIKIYFDSYPFDTSFLPIYTLLPEWLKRGNLETMCESIKNTNISERILKELPPLSSDSIVVAQAPEADFLVGKTLGAFAENQNLDLNRALLKLMDATRLRATVFYRNINMDLAIESLRSPAALIASNGVSFPPGSAHLRHERLWNTFPRFLEIVLGSRLMTLETAIQKITSTPASIFGLEGRGVIREGNIADLTLVKSGIPSHVFVNGALTVSEGVSNQSLSGTIIRKTVS